MNKNHMKPLAAAVLAALSCLVQAQQAETVLGEVTVKATSGKEAPNGRIALDASNSTGSRLGLTPRETPATINIVDRATMDARGVQDTAEAAAYAPGVTFHGSPGSGGVLSMRGFTSSQVSQLFNGIDVGYIISTSPVDAWHLDRVEVLGGASSFLYGNGAVGGAVNFVTKTATREPLSQESLIRLGRFGTYQLAYSVNGAVSGPDARNFVRADLSVQGTKGYVDRTDGRSTVLSTSWLADLAPGLSHTLAWEYQSKDHTPYWGTPLLNPATDAKYDPGIRYKNYNTADGAYEQTVNWIRSILEYRLSDKTQITNTLYHYDAERDYRNVESYRYNATNTLIARSSTLAQKHGQSIIGDKIELLHKGSIAGQPSTTSLGLDLSRNKQTRFPTSLSTTVSTVDPYNYRVENFSDILGVTPATNPDRTNRLYTRAFYAENQTRLGSGFSVISGLRAESIKLDAYNYRAVDANNPKYFQNTYNPITGRVGVMYDFSPTANAYVTYSTAADPPAGILTTTNYGSVKDWDLTTGKQLEVGTKLDFLDGRGNATLAAYKIERKNLSTPDPDNPNNSLPIGQQSSKGVEAQVGFKFSPQWRLQGNLALVSAQYDKFIQNVSGVAVSRAGNRPTGIPDRVANLFVTWTPDPKWEANLGVRYVSERYGNVENTQKLAAYTLVDAALGYKIDHRNTLEMRVRNLTDEEYIVSGSSQVIIGAPRTYEVALRSRF